ncbi:MAG: YlbF family regulator [Erysipelotrichales bacterium]|nr:YlbF family regulator [Erysipelotrichales bacterium]
MSNFDSQLEKLKDKLFDQESVKTYFSLKSQIEQSTELNELRNKIRYYAQEMTKNMDDDETYFKNKELYERVLSEYNEHPLVVDYNVVAEEVNNLLKQLKNIIE